MIQIKPIEQGVVAVKSTIRINHPQADLLTVQIGHNAHCNFPLTVELALSQGYDFLDHALPELFAYAFLIDDTDTQTYYNMRSNDNQGLVMTYREVPLAVLAKFLNVYAQV